MILAAVFSLSLSSLSYELLITRFFSIAHWSHLSFLAVGVAMFGYAAGGAAFGLVRRGERRQPSSLLMAALLTCSLSTIGSFLAVKALPLDYLRFPVDRAQAFYLLLSWILLSLPFFACGAASVAAYSHRPDLSGAIAGASLLGSAAGALAPAVLLPLVEEGGCVVFSALVPLAAAFIAARRLAPRILSALCCALLGALFAWQRAGALAVAPSPYKTLPLLRQAPGTVVTSRTPGLRGRLEVVESPSIRFAPGLSLAWQDELPRQTGLVTDGDALSVLYDFSDRGAPRFAAWTHSFAPFVVAGQGNCLILQQDGGLAAACAIASLSPGVLVLEDPRVARRAAFQYDGQHLRVIAESPRAYLARPGSAFSTILIEDWGPSLPGMASLQADNLLTVDSFRACWMRLDRGGALAVSRRNVLPPSDSLRLFSEILQALSDAGVADPSSHLAVIRSWDSCTIVAAREPLRGATLERLAAFSESRAFDLDYYPGVDPSRTNRFSRYQQPLFAEAYLGITQDAGYVRRQALDVAPQTDDRPFPSHFVKWTRVKDFSRATGGRAYTLLLTGEIIAGTVLVEVVVVGAALLAAMLVPGRRHRGGPRGAAGLFLLVGMTGIGFMATEMYAINAASLLFPSPGVSLSISLGGILLFSALGGAASEAVPRRALGPILFTASAASAAFCLALPAAFSSALPAAFPGKAAAALGLLALPGFLIGIPFPAAMRVLASDSRQRAQAWAVNGCASVIVAAASALVAPAAGFRALLVAAAAAYAIAAAAAAALQRRPVTP